MRLELGAGAALLIGNVVAVIVTHADPVDVEDGMYIPFQDALDNVAPCALDDARAADLYGRFVIVDGCVAGGHDDLDGDGHLDCWTAQYNGGSGGGVGRISVRRRCLGEPVVATWSSGDQLELDVSCEAGEALARGLARFVRP